jgi:predicted PurR-regulated permease PerM
MARRGISPAISAVLLVGSLAIVVGGIAALIRAPVTDAMSQAPQIMQSLQLRLEELRRPFVALSEASREVAQPSGVPGSTETITVTEREPTILDWLISTLADVGSVIVATLLLSPFLLASTETLKLKLIRLFPQLKDKKRSLRVVHDIETRVSRYLVTVSIINAGLGTLIGLAMWLLGMPNPILWGLGAMLLNYVPYIGPVTGIALCAAVSLTIQPDLLNALAPPAAYAAINSIEGTFVTPLTVGRRLSLSIVAILITLGLTTWMWGIVGTLIGVPLLVVVKAFCDEFPSLSQVGIFISAESTPTEEAGEATPVAGNGHPVANGGLVAPRVDHAL